MVSPNSPQEQVLKINEGDAIPVPLGVVSWWFNGGDTDVAIIFLGETTKVYTPGQFTYFFLTGALGIFGALSTNFITWGFDLYQEESEKLTKSQTRALIIKLGRKGITFPEPTEDLPVQLSASIANALPDVDVKGGGTFLALTETNFPLLGGSGIKCHFSKAGA